jgi:hypothetical protein
LLKPDHSMARVRLDRQPKAIASDPRNATQAIEIGLAPDVIVLPVHVHQLAAADGSLRIAYLPEQMRASFEPLGIVTTAASSRDMPGSPAISTTIRTRRWPPVGKEPDRSWAKADIQFRLASYDIVRQDAGLNRELISTDEVNSFGNACTQADRLTDLHTRNEGDAGIHIYLGGNIEQIIGGTLVEVPGVTCGASLSCRTSVAKGDFILLDDSKLRAAPWTIPQELGHYLGLRASTAAGACGRSLLDDPGNDAEREANLMYPRATAGNLSAGQRTRARTLACSAFRVWGRVAGFTAPSCP